MTFAQTPRYSNGVPKRTAVHESYTPLTNRFERHGGHHPCQREAPRHDHEGEEHPPLGSVDEKGEKKKTAHKKMLKRKNAHKTSNGIF